MVNMPNSSILAQIRTIVPADDLMCDEPMSRHTSFQVGGRAAYFIRISEHTQIMRLIALFREQEMDFFILGNGSNVLVGDKGYPGAILHVGAGMSKINVQDNEILAEAGASLSAVAALAAVSGLSGMEFAAGIPGTVGGAIVMNAGAFEGEMAAVVKFVSVFNGAGSLMELDNRAMEFGYRTSIIRKSQHIVISATLRLRHGDPSQIQQKMTELAQKRRIRQPLEYASAGSTFKRPDGHYAGKLIMETGLRGFSVGSAQVSDKHCGFIINKGSATATDISTLIHMVRERVHAHSGILLEPEVIFLGDF